MSMLRRPEIMCFAGPNGSGKSTLTQLILPDVLGSYINADEIQRYTFFSTLEAAQKAESLREEALTQKEDFAFETVLSTDRNLLLLRRAKEQGYFIRCVFVLTCNPNINVQRVRKRVLKGGHGVPEDKIVSRFYKSLDMVKELIPVCDRISIYDNSGLEPFRIYKKRDQEETYWENEFWRCAQIEKLVGKNSFCSK